MGGVFGWFVSSCLFLSGLWGLSAVGLRGCLFVFLSLYFWATLWVFLVVFSVGHEWSMLRLGGSGVLGQGLAMVLLECVFFFLDETIR